MAHRPLRSSLFLFSTAFALLLLPMLGCRRPVSIVAPSERSDPGILEYVAKGDEYFRHRDLCGWRTAEDFYAKALSLRDNAELADKLILTRVLRISREIDEGISTGGSGKALAADCASPRNARQQSLCDFASKYTAPRAPVTRDRATQRVPVPDLQDICPDPEDLDAYLQILYSQAYGFEVEKSFRATASEQFKGSPLFLYLNLNKLTSQAMIELVKSFPDFAELFVVTGERLMQAKRYREARTYFNKALELIPDYTRAINGLGNIYLYVLEEYPEALRLYNAALRYDPANTGALYGKGAVLHSVGSFAESNRVFDQMIATDISRGGRLSEFNVHFYRGMARYYQAYSHYHLSQPIEARRLIDLAKYDLPESEVVNYLSGVFYFNANQMDSARADFDRVLAGGSSNCEANNYLGLIYLQTDEYKTANYFLRMCSCVGSAIASTRREIASLPSLDLEPPELDGLKANLEQKLSKFSTSSADMIRNAILMVDLTHNERKDIYKKLMEETLHRVQPETRVPLGDPRAPPGRRQ
jgi:tetratricopeptide (TPR) repeat protein